MHRMKSFDHDPMTFSTPSPSKIWLIVRSVIGV
jgi:hypothetical protein